MGSKTEQEGSRREQPKADQREQALASFLLTGTDQ
jgi:hypothetical protein